MTLLCLPSDNFFAKRTERTERKYRDFLKNTRQSRSGIGHVCMVIEWLTLLLRHENQSIIFSYIYLAVFG